MPRSRPLFLPNDTLRRSEDLDFSTKVSESISSLTFPSVVEDAQRSLREIGFGDPDATEWQPTPSYRPDPLPVVTTDASEPGPFGQPAASAQGASFQVPQAPEEAPQTIELPGQTAVGGSPVAMPTGGGPTTPIGAPGPAPELGRGSDPENQARAYQAARASGLDDEGARVLVAVTETEGGTRGAIGDQGQSRGAYQFHAKGQMPGFVSWLQQQGIQGDPNQLVNDIDITTRYAATTYLGRAIAEGRKQGLTGSQLATYVQTNGQISQNPGRTGENYERLFGGGQSAAPAPAPAPRPTAVSQASAAPTETGPPPRVVALNTPNTGGPRRATRGIVVHSTNGGASTPEDEYQGTLRHFANPASQVSAHAVIAADGTIAQVGDWNAQTWHAGENNADRIGIEIVQTAKDNIAGKPFTDAQYRSLAWLTGKLSRQYGFGIDRDSLVGHQEIEQGKRSGKIDPGAHFDWNRYLQEASTAAGAPVAQAAGVASAPAGSPSFAGSGAPHTGPGTTAQIGAGPESLQASALSLKDFGQPSDMPLDDGGSAPRYEVVGASTGEPIANPMQTAETSIPRPIEVVGAATNQPVNAPAYEAPVAPRPKMLPVWDDNGEVVGYRQSDLSALPADEELAPREAPRPTYGPELPPPPAIAAATNARSGMQDDRELAPARGFFEPTATERQAAGAATQQIASPDPVKIPQQTPESWPSALRAVVDPILGALQTPSGNAAAGRVVGAAGLLTAGSDYLTGRGINPWVPLLTRFGIAERELQPDQLARLKELNEKSMAGDMRGGGTGLTPEETDEYNAIMASLGQRYEQIKNDPDQLTEAYNAAPGSVILPLLTSVVGMGLGSGAKGAVSAAATRAGVGARTARSAGYAADIVTQTALDPTSIVQPAFDAPIAGVGAAIRGARGAVGAATEGIGNAYRAGREGAARAAERSGETVLGVGGPVPDPEIRIPRAGYATDLSPGAESMVRRATEANAPQEVVRRAEVGQKAQDILGIDPERVRAWQDEALAEAPDARPVRGEALRQSEYIDAENADRAIERLRAAHERARTARESGLDLSADENTDIADALLEAAQTARAFSRSERASTAEGRATARALSQRRNAITARAAFETAARARQVGQDAAFAAQEVLRAASRGDSGPQRLDALRRVRDKLADADRNGLIGDGAGGRLDRLDPPAQGEMPAGRPPITPGRVDRSQIPTGRRLRGTAGPTESPSAGAPFLTRAATDLGNAALGSIVGGTAGYMAPADSDEERLRNARIGVAVGGLGYPAVGRMMRGRGGALAAFGPAPTPENPRRALAVGADPSKRYEFRYRVADLRDLIPSNTPSGAKNPAFPAELQPRSRERAASQLQIDRIAQGLEPDALLNDFGRLDVGPMIVGADNLVESGNGRVLALQRAAQQHPENYQAYVDALRKQVADYGMTDADLANVQLPVLVRERVTDVDRAAFVQEANISAVQRMSGAETAAQGASKLSDDVVANLTIGENDTIASALRRTDNRDLVRQWVSSMPEDEASAFLDAKGNISPAGYDQLANTLLVRTYGDGAGTRAFIEAADPDVRNVQVAIMGSLPDVARAEALVRAGQRDAGLGIAQDVAAATEVLGRLKREGISVSDYIKQVAMGERELTPFQEELLQFLNQNQRRPNSIRQALREYAAGVENAADPNQVDMFGGEVAAASKEDVWAGATAGIQRERQARIAAQQTKSEAEYAARTPASEIIPSGGPEGTLAVEGAPTRAANLPPVGDLQTGTNARGRQLAPGEVAPEGRLMREGAPPESANLPAVGDMRTGAPEGTLTQRSIEAGGPDATLTLASGRSIKDVVSQIDEVLANPQAPGAADRLRELHDDLKEISTLGHKRSSDIRQRLHRNGLLRAGMAGKDTNVEPLVNALARVDPNNPAEMQAVLNIISKPRLIDRLLEYQYVNMLSSPITQFVNISSNAMQIAGRLLLQNPLEFAYSSGRSTGVGSAFEGAGRGFREGLGEAKQIMRTGTSSERVDRALEMGDYSHVSRESLPAWMHVISTRPLAAMDALLGHTAYASAAEQYAQRTADGLLRNKAPAVAGMSREAARQHVLANIWDYPDIIEKAGKIEDYTLLRSKDTEGSGWGRIERNLRMLASSRNPAEDAGFGGQVAAFMLNQVVPFFNALLNFAKQGAERTVGVPVNAVQAARAFARGDVERGAELASKATIGAAALTAAGALAASDNLTGDGPSDPGKRAIWELTHKRNSFRVPGTDQWISWEGTPFAIPFGMMAGVKEGWSEASERSAKKGQSDPLDLYGSAILKAGSGAAQGFFSQSFVRGLADQYKLLTGQDVSMAGQAAAAAGTVSRFIPSSSMLNFMARISDTMERDPGKPLAVSDLPENIGARLATRIPGARQQVDPKLDSFGEPVPNEQVGVLGVLPYYRGEGARAGDPITRAVESKGVGAIATPSEVPAGITEGVPIPLTMREQRIFQQTAGRQWRNLMRENNVAAGGFSDQAIERLRSVARQAGVAAALAAIPAEERQKRVEAALRRKAG